MNKDEKKQEKELSYLIFAKEQIKKAAIKESKHLFNRLKDLKKTKCKSAKEKYEERVICEELYIKARTIEETKRDIKKYKTRLLNLGNNKSRLKK